MNEKILKYTNLIYKVMNDLHCNSDEETQDEMFFEGLMGLYNGINNYRDNGKTKETTYYYVCIKNAIMTKFHYKTRDKRDCFKEISLETILYGETKIEDVLASDFDIEREIIKQEQLETLCKALNNTKETSYKQYLVEYYGLGVPKLKMSEIAKKYGVSRSNVCQSIRQGIKYLKKKVKKEYEKKDKKINQ